MSALIQKLKPHLMPVAILLICAFGIYGATFSHHFLVNWDDNVYVTDNPAIRGITPEHLKSAFSTYYSGNYAPLQIISYMIDYAVWGLDAGGFLVTNTLLHAANALLFYCVTLRLSGSRAWAMIAAFIFLCHPVQVESVAWISQRKNVLAMFFFLISLMAYLSYQEHKGSTGWRWYLLSLLAFLFATLSKSVTVVLPVVLLAKNLCFVNTSGKGRRFIDTLPYWGIAAAASLLAYVSQDPDIGGGRAGYWGGSLASNCLTMPPVFVRYIGMIFWPLKLSAVYAQPFKEVFDLQVGFSVLSLAACLAGMVYLYKRDKPLCFWMALFFIGLIPVSQIVPLVTLMNDRYLYFPLLGAAGLAGGLSVQLFDRLRPEWRKAALFAIVLPLMPLPVLSRMKAQVWADTETLWRDAVKNEPRASMAWLGLGHAMLYRGHMHEAQDALLRSYELFQQDEDTLLNLSDLYSHHQEPLVARRYLLELQSVNSRNVKGLVALGKNYLTTRELSNAEKYLRSALTIKPEDPDILMLLGEVTAMDGRLDQAEAFYLRASNAGADPAKAEYCLARTVAASGQPDKALLHLERALQEGFTAYLEIDNDQAFAGLRDSREFKNLLIRYADPGSSNKRRETGQ